jgi:hypothetical protein
MSARANKITAGAWVLVATLFAHVAGYWFAFQDAHSRQHALEATGHGWLGMLYPALAAAGLAALLGSLRGRRNHDSGKAASPFRFFCAGVAAYLFIEIAERVMHMGFSADLIHHLSSVSTWLPIAAGLAALCVLSPVLFLIRSAIEKKAPSTVQKREQALSYFLTDQVSLRAVLTNQSSPRAPPVFWPHIQRN